MTHQRSLGQSHLRRARPWFFVLVAGLAITAGGCRSTVPPCPPCAPEIRTIEVQVPVPVPCHVVLVGPPAERLPQVAPGDTKGTLEALLADLLAWRKAYEAQRIAAEACAAEGQ